MINSQAAKAKEARVDVTGHLWIEYQKREVEVEHQTEDYPQRLASVPSPASASIQVYNC